ncbi:MAG: hypothetical protein CMB11_04930 [Euryarchaeota archaeon]|nr:hypothetical protein [Euryarchaeota archaeon]
MVRIIALRRDYSKCPRTARSTTTEHLFPEPSTLPPWITSPSALKVWYENANKLRRVDTVELWRNGAAQGSVFTLADMANLRKMDHPFGEFAECVVTVDNTNYSYRITMELKLRLQDADALAKVENLEHVTFYYQDQPLTSVGQRPVWTSTARYELRDYGRVLKPFLCLSREDVRPFSIVLHGPTAMWAALRAFVWSRAIALYWQGRTHRRLYPPGGMGRMLERLAQEQWGLRKELWA